MTGVDVDEFARVFVKNAAQLPASGDNRWDPDTDRYYFRLDFDRLQKAEVGVSDVLTKLRRGYDVEVVHRVESPTVVKERRYVETAEDVPGGYKVEEGPNGGTYYETNPTNAPIQSLSADEKVGYDGQPVYAVLADHVTAGDEVAFERSDGSRDVGTVSEVRDDRVTVETGDGVLDVQPAPFGPSEQSETAKAEGGDGGGDATVTSGTEGVHNTRHSPDDEDDEEPENATDHDDVEKAEDGVWVSYVGPQGGEGWLNLQTCEVRYQAQRPGEGVEGEDEWHDGWEQYDGDPSELSEGDEIQFDMNGQTMTGRVEINNWDDTGKVYVESAEPDSDWASTYLSESVAENWDVEAVQPGPASDGDVADAIGGLEAELDFEVGDAVMVGDETAEVVDTDPDDVQSYLLDFDDGSTVWSDGTNVESFYDSTTLDPDEKPLWVEQDGIAVGDTIQFDAMDESDDAEVVGFSDGSAAAEEGTPVIDGGELDWWDGDQSIAVEEEYYEGVEASNDDLGDPTDELDSFLDDQLDEQDDDPEPEVTSDPSEAVANADGWRDHVGDYDVSDFDEGDMEEWGPLSKHGFPSGVSGAHMDVGVTPGTEYDDPSDVENRDLVFRRKFGDDALDPQTGHRQMVAYTIGDALGGQMPEHAGHAEEDGEVVANGVNGYDIISAPDEVLEQVDEDQFYEQAAVQIILGNNDAHRSNVKVTPDGDLVFHDIDHAAGDISSDFVGEKGQYDDALDRVLGELYRSATQVIDDDEEAVKQKMLDSAVELAEEHANTGANSTNDDGFETFAECVDEKAGEVDDEEGFCASIFFGGDGDNELAQALQQAVGYSPELANNVQNNIQNLANGDIAWQ